MRNPGQLFIGVVILLIGLVSLIGNLFDLDPWDFWPILLIGLGLWLLLRPRLVGRDTAVRQRLLGDVRRRGAWSVADEEIWVGIGEVDLDLTQADIPLGETRLSVFGFVGDVEVTVPEKVGVAVSCTAFVTDAKVLGQRREVILSPVHLVSDDYETAERKIRLQMTHFVGDLEVCRA